MAHIQALLEKLNDYSHKHHLSVHRCIDYYYYLQKTEELIAIHETQLRYRLAPEQVERHYVEIYTRWRRDVRWLNKHLLFNEPCPQTFSSEPMARFTLGQI